MFFCPVVAAVAASRGVSSPIAGCSLVPLVSALTPSSQGVVPLCAPHEFVFPLAVSLSTTYELFLAFLKAGSYILNYVCAYLQRNVLNLPYGQFRKHENLD